MTDPGQPNAPATPRPAVVTASSYLLYAAAAVTVVNAVISLAFIGTTAGAIRDVYEGTAAEGAEGVAVAAGVAGAVFYLMFAAALIVLGILNGRGRNPSRIVTWVLGGLGVCCGGLGALSSIASNSMSLGSPSGPDMPDAAEMQRSLAEALPGWYTPVTTSLTVLAAVLTLAAVILLALPAAHPFFRRPEHTWTPPVQGLSPYPAPQYPAQPGDPQRANPPSE